jgi:predicted small secreted protein
MAKRILLVAFLIVAAFGLVGCQTVQGLGTDINDVFYKAL